MKNKKTKKRTNWLHILQPLKTKKDSLSEFQSDSHTQKNSYNTGYNKKLYKKGFLQGFLKL